MARLKCLCGNSLSNVCSPNEMEGYLLTDMDMEFDDDKSCLDIMDIARCVWECDKCGRLAFNFPNKDSDTVKWYKPENGENGGLMKFAS